MLNDVAGDVTDPETNISVLDRRKDRDIINAADSKLKKDLLARKIVPITALGSGSDYSPFIQHIGVPCIDLGFGGENGGGEYHSIYDSYDDYRRFKDPGSVYGVVLAKMAGRTTLRMADADILPFDFKSLYKTINGYVTEVSALLDQSRETTALENQLIKEKRYGYAADPNKHELPPVAKDEVPYISFSPLQNAMIALEKSSNKLSDYIAKGNLSAAQKNTLNKQLYQAEQQLLSESGLPRRPWYRHTIYAPGFYTGYGVKTLPGIREAIEQRDWKEAQQQVEVDAAAITRFSAWLNSAAGN